MIAVFNESGIWEESLRGVETYLSSRGLDSRRLSAAEINSAAISGFTGIVFPGGLGVGGDLSSTGRGRIRSFVSGGGFFFGVCSGAYAAARTIIWEGYTSNNPYYIFDGTARGSISAIAPWPSQTQTVLRINQASFAAGLPSTITALYYGGPYFVANGTATTVATYNSYGNAIAALNTSYGSGLVVLIGFHPEVSTTNYQFLDKVFGHLLGVRRSAIDIYTLQGKRVFQALDRLGDGIEYANGFSDSEYLSLLLKTSAYLPSGFDETDYDRIGDLLADLAVLRTQYSATEQKFIAYDNPSVIDPLDLLGKEFWRGANIGG